MKMMESEKPITGQNEPKESEMERGENSRGVNRVGEKFIPAAPRPLFFLSFS